MFDRLEVNQVLILSTDKKYRQKLSACAVHQLACGRLQKRTPIDADHADMAVSRKASSRLMHITGNRLPTLRLTSTRFG